MPWQRPPKSTIHAHRRQPHSQTRAYTLDHVYKDLFDNIRAGCDAGVKIRNYTATDKHISDRRPPHAGETHKRHELRFSMKVFRYAHAA